MIIRQTHQRTFTHLELFCGLGGLSAGISDAVATHCGLEGRFRCVGAIDVDPRKVEAYNAYTGDVAGAPFFMKQVGGARNKKADVDDLPSDLRIREMPDVWTSNDCYLMR